MNIYVDELPKNCECCSLLSRSKMKINSNGKYVDTKCCVLGQFYKYTTIDDEINSCPLKIIPSDDKRILEFFESIKIQQVIAEGRARQLEEQLSKAIVPKLEIGQRVYMIPNEFNGLNNLTEYEVLDYNLSSLGVRFNLTIINKQKGIEPFYCASEDMIGLSIFSTKEEAESKLKGLKSE